MIYILSLLLSIKPLQGTEVHKFKYVTEQAFDTSCGLAILSDLMTRFWNCKVCEYELIQRWLEWKSNNNKQQNATYSISFLDMQSLLNIYGFTSRAYKLQYEDLIQISTNYSPIIIHLSDQNGHFVLCLAAYEDFIIISDPAEGTYWLSRKAFNDRWKGYCILVTSKLAIRNNNNLEEVVCDVIERKNHLFSLPYKY
ncbi:MAG TPA: cysteine peptidase family C39 domain-containing protein [Treponema sp.]|nr:cysteine peptidase family C39 domain-containing protein [Treponema sp.]HRU28457.1 cysteine peptidase family C39 domain-containing protein [Treponema sp.]